MVLEKCFQNIVECEKIECFRSDTINRYARITVTCSYGTKYTTYFGHLMRKENGMARGLIEVTIEGTRPRGRPPARWFDTRYNGVRFTDVQSLRTIKRKLVKSSLMAYHSHDTSLGLVIDQDDRYRYYIYDKSEKVLRWFFKHR